MQTMPLIEIPTAPLPGDVIVVWFSCGAASAVAVKETIAKALVEANYFLEAGEVAA